MRPGDLPWGAIVTLGLVALARPLLSITGLADDWGRPATPLLATLVISVLWVVVGSRLDRPLASLIAAGLVYATAATVLSGILSPILEGELQGPLTNPFALLAVLVVNVAWGAACGVAALGLAVLVRRH